MIEKGSNLLNKLFGKTISQIIVIIEFASCMVSVIKVTKYSVTIMMPILVFRFHGIVQITAERQNRSFGQSIAPYGICSTIKMFTSALIKSCLSLIGH